MPLQTIDSKHLAALEAELARVTAQRDALRDALQFSHDVFWSDHAINTTPEGRRAMQAVNKARNALQACQD